MSNTQRQLSTREAAHSNEAAATHPSAEAPAGMSKSMHDGVAFWCDCCSCEAEPYWAALAGEAGMEGDGDRNGDDEDHC
jgi:hypothetical protein